MGMKDFQITLKAARVNAGYTIVEASKLAGICKDTLIKWEKHPEVISVKNASLLAKLYRCPLNVIYFGE